MEEKGAFDYSAPRPRSIDSLQRLLAIMRCPVTYEPLQLAEDRGSVVSIESGRRWPCLGFVPQMFDELDAKLYPVEHQSNGLAPQALKIVQETDGLVLNLSAGGSEAWFPNVVEAEAGIFRNTDTVADAHNLPFQDGVFSACIAMNAFEHYHSPGLAANEIYRVLKPGAPLLIHTAFLQPVHEPPFHFYNATPFGVMKWFERFENAEVSTPFNFNPVFGLSWIIASLDNGLMSEGKLEAAALLRRTTLEDLSCFWRDPTTRHGEVWDAFFAGSASLQGQLAAGVQFTGSKPR